MYAVIFRSLRTSHSDDLYQEYSEKMEELVRVSMAISDTMASEIQKLA
jgi:hypothetical protein